MANYSYKFPDQVNVQGFGITFEATNKAPLELNRIFETLEKAQAYIDDVNDKAIPGLNLSVIKDGANNGVYHVIEKSGTPNGLAFSKLSSSGDIPEIPVKNISGDDTTINVTNTDGDYKVEIIESGITDIIYKTISGSSAHTVVEEGDNVTVTSTGVNKYKISVTDDTINDKIDNYLTTNDYTTSGDVVNIISGVSGDVETLKANSAHTTVSQGTNVIVTKTDKDYKIDVPDSAITSVAKSSVKVVIGTNTTVTEGTDGDKTTYAVNVDLSEYLKGSDLKGDNKYIEVTNNKEVKLIETALTDTIQAQSITSATATYEGTTPSASYSKGALTIKYPQPSEGHAYTGDEYITVDNTADTIKFNATKLPKAITTVDAKYEGTTPTGSFDNGTLTIKYPKAVTTGSVLTGTEYAAVVDENGSLNITIPEATAPKVYTSGDEYIDVNNTTNKISLNTSKLPASITGASATFKDGDPTAVIKNGVIEITYPDQYDEYSGDGEYIDVVDKQISFRDNMLDDFVTGITTTDTGTTLTGTVENQVIKLNVPKADCMVTGGSITSSTQGFSANVENKVLKLTIPEAEVYDAEKKEVEWNKPVNLTADTTNKKYVLDYPNFQAVTPQSDFGSTQEKYGQITTGVTAYPAANGEIGKAVYVLEKSISGTQQVIVDDEQIFEKGVENLANAAGLVKDNIIQYTPYTAIDTCIKDATSLYTADVEMAKEIRNLWIAFNDIATKLGIK